MGILGNIFSKIFPSAHAANANANAGAAPAPASTTPAGTAATAPAAASGATSAQSPQAISAVDVEQILDGLASKATQKLNWKTSIVDLLKLLDLDSSLGARKQLAAELNFTGDTSDSATMNVWLHRQVMNKLAANGGKVPADLKD
jgi:3-oxoacyl-ACP reductase-like protein